ncbi:MAG: DUF433 domain-containing protein [bacterium]|nr:DUF433 domain-containing protein [bacterium]
MAVQTAAKRDQYEAIHSYIERKQGVLGGKPVIRGTRISVALIVELQRMGKSVDEIVTLYPHLSHAQIYEALSYYYDHKEEIERMIYEDSEEYVREKYKGEAWLS